MQRIEALQELLGTPRKAVIFPHVSPDADALGSSLAMAGLLGKLGHEATVISPNEYPRFLDWMPGNADVLVYEREDGPDQKPLIRQRIDEADVIFYLDFSSRNRIEGLQALTEKSAAKTVLIDHHQGKQIEADFELWEVNASSTCELVYEFMHRLGYGGLIDLNIGECLYAGIVTDTGSFKHPSTNASVHRIAADLMEKGLDTARIHRLIYDTNSLNRLRFLGYALHELLTVVPEHSAAYFAIKADDLQRFASENGDTEGLVNYALSIEGVHLAALFAEKDGSVKMSFRSEGEFSVADLAKKHFKGGGHKNAAGGKITDEPLEAIIRRFESLLPLHSESLRQSASA